MKMSCSWRDVLRVWVRRKRERDDKKKEDGLETEKVLFSRFINRVERM